MHLSCHTFQVKNVFPASHDDGNQNSRKLKIYFPPRRLKAFAQEQNNRMQEKKKNKKLKEEEEEEKIIIGGWSKATKQQQQQAGLAEGSAQRPRP